MMPGLALAYFTHTLDRDNLGNAKTDGFEKDLGLVENQYSLLLVLFYVPYALFNIPCSILAKRYNSARVIPLAILAWGVCTMGAAAAKNFAGIMATRIIMDKPCEMGFIAGAVSSLISWSGWQYLFLIEGSITILVAIYLWTFAPKSPETSRWYTEEEEFLWDDANKQLEHWPTWVFAFMALMYGVGVASSSNFLPTMINRLTSESTTANLYTVGPNLAASVFQLSICWLSDRYQQRATFACATTAVSLVAWILLGTLDLVHQPQVGYFLTYLITFATFIPSNLVLAWLSSDTPTTTGRVVSLGLDYMAMNLAGIVSSLTYKTEDAPVYRPALITVGCSRGVFILAAVAMRQYYVKLNKKIDSGELPCAPGMESRPEYRYAI
ncbi:MFS general substrate transporter [Hypoxylon sp. FL1150]|nr:MFS general substrate transporter [Hypoxylon sp. FL1150]